MAGASYTVEGWRELNAALKRIGGGAQKQMRRRLKEDVGAPFVRDVQQKIGERGLVKSGRLRGSIKTSVTASYVDIVSRPALNPGKHSRMGYAAVYEFGNGGARNFMKPIQQKWDGPILDEHMRGFLDWVEMEWSE